MGRRPMTRVLVALCGGLLVAVLASAQEAGDKGDDKGANNDEKDAPIGLPGHVNRALQRVAEKVTPAIVQLRVERYEATAKRERHERRLRRGVRRGFELEDGFEEADVKLRYFERPNGPATGVIIERTGLVVTSKFNVEGAIRRLTVALPDGRVFPGIVLGWNGGYDIAVVRIVANGAVFPCVDITAPDPVPPVGSTIGVVGVGWGRKRHTINPGIVSALNRKGGRAMQLCTHLNYGNSGGAVIDLTGRLIGIAAHVRPFNRTGQNSGVGFCTRTDKIIEQLASLRRGERKDVEAAPFLGIRVTSQDEMRGRDRVYIEQVIPGSGAETAGVKVGDALLSIGGTRIVEPADLRLAMARLKPGRVVNMVVVREGKQMRIPVTVGTRE